MNSQLHQILDSICEEPKLYPSTLNKTEKEEADAWERVSSKNSVTVHEVKSIFNILLKKYHQEKLKPKTTWKFMATMQELHEPRDIKEECGDGSGMDDEAFIELLEVKEEDEYSDENDENESELQKTNTSNNSEKGNDSKLKISPKVLNSQKSLKTDLQQPKQTKLETVSDKQSQKTALSQNTKIFPRGRTPTAKQPLLPTVRDMKRRESHDSASQTTTPTAPKRKLIESKKNDSVPAKRDKPTQAQSVPTTTHAQSQTSSEKSTISIVAVVPPPSTQEIFVPAEQAKDPNFLANGTIIQTNGFHEVQSNTKSTGNTMEMDLSASSGAEFNGNEASQANDLVDFGNFNNHLPPTFFKNLCNSKRHEALGLYISNVMNRLPTRLASKLELSVLKLIVEFQQEHLDKLN